MTLFILAFLAIHLTSVLTGISPVLQGELIDTDGYMRALRVERLVETGDWFDGIESRSNAPFGESSHWTRPLDVIVAAVALPLVPVLDTRDGVFWAAVLALPLLTFFIYFGAAWAVRPLVGPSVSLLVPFLALAQPMVAGYALPGRLDHHSLILLLFVLSLGFLLRALGADRGGRGAEAAGALAGAGLWVSAEFLAPLAALFAGLALGWIARGEERARAGVRFSAALCAVVVLAILLEHGGEALRAVEYDRISLPHLLMAFLALAFWAGARMAPKPISWRGRAAASGGGALAAGGILALFFPAFFGGPWVHVNPAVADLWLWRVRELRPLLPGLGGDLGSMLLYLGPVAVALPWLAHRTWRARRTPELPSWTLLVVGLVGFTSLALYQARWSIYAEVLAAVGLAGAVVASLRALGGVAKTAGRVVGRAAVVTAALIGFPLLGGLLMGGESPQHGGAPSSCELGPALGALDGGSRPRTILAFMDFGPEILYRSPHHVVATPYHRNLGIAASHRILATMDPADARQALRRRGVDVILLCPPWDEEFFAQGSDPPSGPSLYELLRRGEAPDWLRSLSVPEESGFLLFAMTE